MKIKVLSGKGLERRVRIVADPAEVERRLDAVTEEYRKEAALPGFRKSQAPARLVFARFQRDICSDVAAELVEQGLKQAAEEQKLDIAAILAVEPGEVKRGEAFRAEIRLELIPEFALPEYKGIKVEIEKLPDEAKLAEEHLEMMRQFWARLVPADGPAEAGDMVVVDYEGVHRGRSLKESAEVPPHLAEARGVEISQEVERGSLPQSFYQQVIGMSKDERRQISVVFPKEYPVRDLAGKDVTYFVHVKEVYRRLLPTLDDAGARQMGFRGIAELRARAEESARQTQKKIRESRVRDAAIRHLLKATRCEVPSSWSRAELPGVLREFEQQLGAVNLDDEKAKKIGELAIKSAQDRVKLRMILHRVADQEHLEPSEAEVVEAVAQMAQRSGMPQRQFLRMLRREGWVREIYESLKAAKALRFVAEQAIVQERPS